jgi:hypothetical protein
MGILSFVQKGINRDIRPGAVPARVSNECRLNFGQSPYVISGLFDRLCREKND